MSIPLPPYAFLLIFAAVFRRCFVTRHVFAALRSPLSLWCWCFTLRYYAFVFAAADFDVLLPAFATLSMLMMLAAYFRRWYAAFFAFLLVDYWGAIFAGRCQYFRWLLMMPRHAADDAFIDAADFRAHVFFLIDTPMLFDAFASFFAVAMPRWIFSPPCRFSLISILRADIDWCFFFFSLMLLLYGAALIVSWLSFFRCHW